MMDKKFDVVFVLGPPGCGKGTQCRFIEKSLGFKHLSAGELLRQEMAREQSEFGQLIGDHIKNGTIVPVEITCKLLENTMCEIPAKGYLIDGFPRNQNNLDGWQKQIGDKAKIHFVLYLSCPMEKCMERCMGRTEGRTDDNAQSLKKRLDTYHNQTFPIIKHFESLKLVREVSTLGPPEEVYENVKRVFKEAGF